MKRIFSLILAAGLLCTLFSGCKKEPEKLRICIDIGVDMGELDNDNAYDSSIQKYASAFLAGLISDKAVDLTEEEIELEVIPGHGSKKAERSATLQRIGTEIMSGRGPDLFIMRTEGLATSFDKLETGRLFPFVEIPMEDGTFLPLDSYLEKFERTDLQDIPRVLLEGGKNKAGETVVFPLSYFVPVTIYDRSEVPSQDFSGVSWSDALASADPLLAEQVRWAFSLWTFDEDETMRFDGHEPGIPYLYEEPVDFENRTPGMTEEELVSLVSDAIAAYREQLAKETPRSCGTRLDDMISEQSIEATSFANPRNGEQTMIPLRNLSGGAAAEITMYCAINANTGRAEDCAAVIDYLSSWEFQEKNEMITRGSGFSANGKCHTPYVTGFTDQTREELQHVLSQVTMAQYPTPLDAIFEEMMEEIQAVMLENAPEGTRLEDFILGSISEEELREIVHTHYEEMQRILDET